MIASCGKDGMIIWFLRYDETKKDIESLHVIETQMLV